jgi:hypothetical protein
MSGERVSIIEGHRPIMVVSPHGYQEDDENTALIAESIAHAINCYAVINRGWERADNVDAINDKADCNNATHCHEDVVRDEFLDPIFRFRNRIRKQGHQQVFMFMIHGMGNKHRTLAGNSKLDVVVGYGAGSPDSYTCDLWRKNAFISLLEDVGMTIYEGKKGGQMSGWARNNMNQLFRKWYADASVQSMQLEIIHELRADKDIARLTAEYLATAMQDMSTRQTFSQPRQIRQY